MKTALFFFINFSVLFFAGAQPVTMVNGYPQNYFRSPLDIPLTLSGNFGEPRTGHFHTGLDFKTNMVEGLPVYAAADGYVSRINVSAYGYGNALYITHPNGYVTVYGHLQQFEAKIKKLLVKEQYAKKSFSVDLYLKPGGFPVEKGDLVALSGNTGGSGGPHLHFEIRDSLENPYNPLLFGFKLSDHIKPVVSAIKFYAMDGLKYTSDGYRAKVLLQNGAYQLANGLLKLNALQAGFAINTYDKMDGTDNTYGIYSMKVFDGEKQVYGYCIDKVPFTDKRYVLSHVDYPIFMTEARRSFHKCFVEPNNKCPVYANLVNTGIIDLSDGEIHTLRVEISDKPGNRTIVNFSLQYDKTALVFKGKAPQYTTRFDADKVNELNTPEIKVTVPKGYLFDTAFINYTATVPEGEGVYSKIHQVGNSNIPVFNWFDVAVKTEGLPDGLRDKAAIVYKDNAGSTTYRAGKYENGFIVTRARELGKFYVRIDTAPPKIQPINITAGRNMRTYKKIVFKITDNLSGVDSFESYIDDKWVVTEFDGKSATFTHYISADLAAGEHVYKIVAFDERKNRAEYSVKFNW